MRTALRVGAISLLALAVVAAVVVVVKRDAILARLTASITRALSAQFGDQVAINRVHLDLIPLTLVVDGLTVRSPSPDIPAPPVSVDRIVLRPSLVSLLTQTPVIRWIRVERPRVEVVAGPGGASNLPRPKPNGSVHEGGRPAAIIKRIEIVDAHLSYRSPAVAASLSRAGATVSPDLITGHVDADIEAPAGLVTVGDRTLSVGKTHVRVALERERLAIHEFSATATGVSASGRGTIELGTAPVVDASVTASLDLGAVFAALLPSHRVAGHVDLNARVTGPFSAPAMHGDVAARAVAYDGMMIGDVAAHVEQRAASLTFTDVAGTVLGGSANGRGSIDLGVVPAAWSASVETSRLRPGALIRRFVPNLAALPGYEISGPIRASGRGLSWTAIDADARLAVATIAPADAPAAPPSHQRVLALLNLIASADLPLAFHAGRLELSDASIVGAGGRVTISGTVTTGGAADLSLDAAGHDIAAISRALGLSFATAGVGAFRGGLTGPLASPTVNGRAEIRDLGLRGHAAGHLAATLQYAERRLAIADTTWRDGEARYDTVGTLDWSGRSLPAFDLVATLRRARVDGVLPIAFRALPIVAPADGTFTFKGSPAEFLLTGDLTLGNGSLWGQSFDAGTVRMSIDRQRIIFSRAILRRGESEVRGRGSISYHDGFEATFTAPKLYLQALNLFDMNRLPISGTASASLSMRGTFDRPEMHGTVTITHLEGAGQVLGGGTARLDVADRRLSLTVSLDDQHARLAAALRWEPAFPISADITLENSSLVPLLRPWLPAALADMNAALSGRASIEGPFLDPLRWQVRARISRLSADVGEYVVENQDEIAFRLDGGRLTVESCRLRGTDTTLTVSGAVNLFHEYDLLIVGEADLRLTRLFVPSVTSGRGKTYLVLKISDRWASPKIQGGVTIHNAVIRTRALKQPITVDTVGLFFTERQVVLESLSGSLGNGRVSASGQIKLTGFRADRFGVLIDLSKVQFPLADGLVPTFSGQLVLSGTPESQSLRGELTIDRALYDTRISVQEWLLDMRQRAQQPAPTPETPALARGLSLNIHFTGRDNISIKNNLADAALEVDLSLKGTVDHPYLIGRIETRDATLTFSSNTFDVRMATLDFVDPTRFRPVIDLQATTTVQDYDITLHLAGTIEHFDLGLTSDPSLSETDILALLTVGRTTEQVAQSEGSVGREEATSMAMQQLLEEGVERLPGIDQLVDSFQIDPRYDPDLNTSATELSVGKQFFEKKLALRYSTTLESSARQGIRVEYELARNVFLIGEQDSARGFGGDIRFRFEFR
ncbi:MAG: translocation/assembly module TamB domain-containing protein [Nitrospirota bacterium]